MDQDKEFFVEYRYMGTSGVELETANAGGGADLLTEFDYDTDNIFLRVPIQYPLESVDSPTNEKGDRSNGRPFFIGY